MGGVGGRTAEVSGTSLTVGSSGEAWFSRYPLMKLALLFFPLENRPLFRLKIAHLSDPF
jgi:hypothetical protein